MNDVLIIIVNWNTRQLLKNCLLSIKQNAKTTRYKICVVDNGSSDGSVEMLKAEFTDVILIENNENKGFAAANNQAMDFVDCKYYLLLNSDTLFLDDALDKMVLFAESQKNIAILSPKLIMANGNVQISYGKFVTLWNSILLNLKLKQRFNKNNANLLKSIDVDYTIGACMLVLQEAVRQVGKLDQSYFYYGEDMDWCFRMHKAGWRVVYLADTQIVHLVNSSGSVKYGASRLVADRLAKLLFYQKSYGNFYATIYRTCIIVLSFFNFLLYSIFEKTSTNTNKSLRYAENVKIYNLMFIAFYQNLTTKDLPKI
jgi:GT2 family glycosyltransferase